MKEGEEDGEEEVKAARIRSNATRGKKKDVTYINAHPRMTFSLFSDSFFFFFSCVAEWGYSMQGDERRTRRESGEKGRERSEEYDE